MSKLNDILALLPDNVTKKIKPVDLRTSVEYIYEDMLSQTKDHILTIGAVTATANKAYLSLPPELKNEVVIDGVNHFRTVPQEFNFTPVVSSLKILIVEAKPDAEVFHLVEGEEGPQAKEPTYTGLFIARLIATPTGVVVEESNTDFKLKLEEYWLNHYVTATADKNILGTYDARGSFYITKSASAPGSVTIGGLSKIVPETEDAAKIFYEGREFWIYNATGEPMLLNSTGVSPTDIFLISNKLTPFTVKNNTAIKVKLRGDILEILPSGSDPDLSGYATTAQLATKLTKPAVAGTFAVKFDGTNYTYVAVSGENISNANMIWAGNTTQNLNGFKVSFTNGRFSVPTLELEVTTATTVPNKTWTDGVDEYYTNNAGINYKKITDRIVNVDKTGQAAYSKVMVIHPTTKETVVRDFADPAATTLAVQNANTAQKTAMRTALLGTAVPTNPTLSGISTSFIKRGEDTMITLYGLNLTLLDPSFIYIELPDSTRVYAKSFSNVTAQIISTIWLIPQDTPLGWYFIKIQNGVTVQGLSIAKFEIVENYNNYDFNAIDWKIKSNQTIIGSQVQKAKNSLIITNGFQQEFAIKGSNDFSGQINARWEMTLISTRSGPLAVASPEQYPYIGLTTTTDAQFVNLNDLFTLFKIYTKSDNRTLFSPSGLQIASMITAGTITYKYYISKPIGDKVYLTLIVADVIFNYFVSEPIDSSFDFALFFRLQNPGNYPLPIENYFTAKIVN